MVKIAVYFDWPVAIVTALIYIPAPSKGCAVTLSDIGNVVSNVLCCHIEHTGVSGTTGPAAELPVQTQARLAVVESPLTLWGHHRVACWHKIQTADPRVSLHMLSTHVVIIKCGSPQTFTRIWNLTRMIGKLLGKDKVKMKLEDLQDQNRWRIISRDREQQNRWTAAFSLVKSSKSGQLCHLVRWASRSTVSGSR